MTETADVVIIASGIVGSSVACEVGQKRVRLRPE
jgi:glycine/D-amino acid oxidase-like deaminating enzyme